MNQEKRVTIKSEADKIISEILKKYKLEEKPSVIFDKIKRKVKLNQTIIVALAKRIFLKEINKDELVKLILDQFHISQKSSEQMATNIIEKLIPFIAEISIDSDGSLEENEPKKLTEEADQTKKTDHRQQSPANKQDNYREIIE